MATPKEVKACERCTAPTGAKEYTLTKSGADAGTRVFCDKCAEATAQTEGFELSPIGRKPAGETATEQQDAHGSPPAESSSPRTRR